MFKLCKTKYTWMKQNSLIIITTVICLYVVLFGKTIPCP